MKLPHIASMPVLCQSDDDSSNNSTDGQNQNTPRPMHRAGSTVAFSQEDDSDEDVETPVQPHVGYKKVLVTGGAGFIGNSVAEYLLSRGDDVVIVDEMNDYYDVRIKEANLQVLREKYPEQNRLAIYKGDICDEEFMLSLFENERPEWVCHMAARAGVRPSIQDPYIYIHSNIKGTTHLMELSHKFGVKNFVFASSSSVYGGSKSCYFSEEESVDNPVSPYAASKKACELLAYTYHHLYQLNVSGLRFFTVYGPRGRPDMAPFKFIDRVSRGVEIQQFGDGSSSRDYTYISDIVDGVVRAIDRPHAYEVFNLGKGSGTSLKEFIDLVQKHTNKKATIKVMPDQPGDVPYTCADVSKARRLLGYKAKIPFEDGILRTVTWYNSAYNKKEIEVCPELQANGLGRSASIVDLKSGGES
jgi:UDP-glucuronate 4-epimerase